MNFKDQGAKASAKAVLECGDGELSWFRFGALYCAHLPAVTVAKMAKGEIPRDRIITHINAYIDRIGQGKREEIAHDFLEFPLYNQDVLKFDWGKFEKLFGVLVDNV